MPDCSLDIAIAEKIMGWQRVGNTATRKENTIIFLIYQDEKVLKGVPYEVEKGLYDHSFEAWSPSSDMRDAWQVVEHLVSLGLTPMVYHVNRHFGDEANYWACRVEKSDGLLIEHVTLRVAPTAPLAICKAALAVQEKQQ